jgi:hypothetical protein
VKAEATDDRAATEIDIEIDVEGRWDALALWELLVRFDPSLHTQEKWVVHARVPADDGDALASAMRAIDAWRAERGIDASVRIVA